MSDGKSGRNQDWLTGIQDCRHVYVACRGLAGDTHVCDAYVAAGFFGLDPLSLPAALSGFGGGLPVVFCSDVDGDAAAGAGAEVSPFADSEGVGPGPAPLAASELSDPFADSPLRLSVL